MEKTKLTKVQRAFFEEFTKNSIKNLLLSQALPQYAEDVALAIDDVLADADVSVLSGAIADGFLAQIEFKTLQKVDKFMKSPEYVQANEAASAVLATVQEELGANLRAVADAIAATLDADKAE